LPTTTNPMGRDRVLNNNFVSKTMVSFKQGLSNAKSFFKGFF